MSDSDDPTDSNVLSMKSARGKKNSKKDKENAKLPPPSKAALYGVITDAINHKLLSLLPEFPAKFYVASPAPGVRRVLMELANGVVTAVDEDAVTDVILRYSIDLYETRVSNEYQWDVDTCKKCMKFWKNSTAPVPEPVAMAWSDTPGLTYHRLPWPAPSSSSFEHPLFDEMFNRIKNGEALMRFIGSLFDPASDRQQYVWLFGPGGAGKSALIRVLARVFGQTCRSFEPPREQDVHWTAGLLGIRLAVFPDCNNHGFVRSGIFKQMTGGDRISINPKYQKTFDAELQVKCLFSSNGRPRLSSESADTRRIIYCEMSLPEGVSDDAKASYERRLWEETGEFLATCIYLYNLAPGRLIQTEKEGLDELVAANEEPYAAFFSLYFVLSPDSWVTPEQIIRALKGYNSAEVNRQNFHSWLERIHGIKCSVERIGLDPSHPRKVSRVYRGLRQSFPLEI